MASNAVLLIDDDTTFLRLLSESFLQAGWSCQKAESVTEARETLALGHRFSFAVVDLHLENQSGLDIIAELVEQGARVVILTGYGSVPVALESVRLGAVNFLAKPCSFKELEAALLGPILSASGHAPVGVEVPSLEDVTWDHVQRVLRDSGGNITRAAQSLGIHRQALQRKLRNPPHKRC